MSDTEESFIRLCRLLGLHPQMVENCEVFEAAADLISQLRKRIGELETGLQPFANAFNPASESRYTPVLTMACHEARSLLGDTQ